MLYNETEIEKGECKMEETKSKKKWFWILIPLAVIIVGAVIFFYVRYSKVSVGSLSVSKSAEELTLSAGEFDPEALAAAIPKLSKLKKLSFPNTDLTAEELDLIRSAADGVELDFTVDINGETFDQATQKIDLSGMTADKTADVASKLVLLKDISEIELMSAEGKSALDISDVKQLTEAVPNAQIHYEFDLFGKHISTLDERVEYDSVEIGNEGAEQIREALSIMTGCKYLLLDTCGIDNEVMASIRDEFPDKKIVWRIYLNSGYPFSFLTDEQVIRLTLGLNDENSKVLQYCTDVVYLDIGHNEALTDFSFLKNMPELECLVASLASVTDLSPLVSCQKLIWVELIDCYDLVDISPLKDIPSIRYLSVSETDVTDISCTDYLPNLERFGAVKLNIPEDVQAHFRELHPNCIGIFDYGANPYGYGWRYNHGTTFEYYLKMREVFHYDGGIFGNQKESIYCPIYLKDFEGYPWYEWQK